MLYWMMATRRLRWSHALDRAVALAEALSRPLLILEALNVSYPWACDRHHAAILDGMREHARALAGSPIGYYPYVEPTPGAGRGLLASLADRACAVVTDDSPVFFTPRLLEAAARIESCAVEAVDDCGLLPRRAAGRAFTAAYHFRRFLQRNLTDHLLERPAANPLAGTRLVPFGSVPSDVLERWPAATRAALEDRAFLASLPIDHTVGPTSWTGGHAAGAARLSRFVADVLPRYAEERNDPDADAVSGLSPWLHYGHVSAHEIFDAVASAEGWSPARITEPADGRREGWWGMSASAEAFLDQLVTWRELGYLFTTYEPDYARYESLPEWARATLEDHASDPRPDVYTLEQLATAATGDTLWNAAQRQLTHDGVIHNYLRMLWGKRIIEWTSHPREALDVMIELNNRFALDGRDPNSYSGIFWVLGRFDRGWPERPIFGKVRSMSSAATRRKVRVARYLERWGEQKSL
ncbi:MAG: deoxyribodipyrimidine photolyase [Gemmatimonadota bacterium]